MANSTTMSTVAQWCTAGCILLRDTMSMQCVAVCSKLVVGCVLVHDPLSLAARSLSTSAYSRASPTL